MTTLQFVDKWLWESESRQSGGIPWPKELKNDTVRMIDERMLQLQRDNEALRRRNDNLRKDFLEASAVAEAKCERLNVLLDNNGCRHFESYHPVTKDGWSDTTSLKCKSCGVVIKCDSDWPQINLESIKAILSEPPSTSLTNYIREQTDDIADFVYDANHHSLLYPQSEYHKKALAKLKELRNEQ